MSCILQNNKWHLVIIGLVLLFTKCKKYDENTILLAPPEKVLAKLSNARIVYCKVNGADSTELMQSVFPYYKKLVFHYTYGTYGESRDASEFYNAKFEAETDTHSFVQLYQIDFSKDKKVMLISVYCCGKKYGFIPTLDGQRNTIAYDIIKLTKNELKIKTYSISKNKEYEIYLVK